MLPLTIRHVTTYRYRQPVAFGEHRMMLRPRDSEDQKVIGMLLAITPQPSCLYFDHDAFGNHMASAQFAVRAASLSFESVVDVELSPTNPAALAGEQAFPVDYSWLNDRSLTDCVRRRYADPHDEILRWSRQFLGGGASAGAFDLLTRMSRGIQREFTYRRREAKGIQLPLETLKLGHGSCRDFALLIIEAARSLGLAARFVSGYLAATSIGPIDGEARGAQGATHAWAQVYFPKAGWVDFDPTSGSVGNRMLVAVAVVGDPVDALPLHGTFIGSAADPLGMDVRVSVTARSS
jgi:transglutaminase-like putative cysteine protease